MANIVQNPGFDTIPIFSDAGGPWIRSDTSILTVALDHRSPLSAAVFNTGFDTESLSQTLTTVPGVYELSYWVRREANTAGQLFELV